MLAGSAGKLLSGCDSGILLTGIDRAFFATEYRALLLIPSPSGRGQGEGIKQGYIIDLISPHPNLLPEGEGIIN